MNLLDLLPPPWRDALRPHLDTADTAALSAFVTAEYAAGPVFPPLDDLFTAYRLCPPEACRGCCLGQDPYHRPGQAHGLSFSVRPGVRTPPSLRNVFKELAADLGVAAPATGDLTGWAAQGVLLLNAVLTVREGAAGSHAGKGWEAFTDATIRALNDRDERIVFLLWGGYARRKAGLVTNPATWCWRPGTRARSTREASSAAARSAPPTRPSRTPAVRRSSGRSRPPDRV